MRRRLQISVRGVGRFLLPISVSHRTGCSALSARTSPSCFPFPSRVESDSAGSPPFFFSLVWAVKIEQLISS